MPDYIGGGDPDTPKNPKGGKVMSNSEYFPPSSQGTDARSLDVRDVIAGFVNRGDRNLKNDEARKGFAYLSANMGTDQAHKLINHLIIFNQRSDQQQKPFEQRLQSLYDIGSADKETDGLLKRIGGMGTGPVAGAKNSANLGVMSAYNPPAATVPMASVMINRKG